MRFTAEAETSTALQKWARWIATGMGVGYFPRMPGTVGSVAGFFIFLLLRNLSTVEYSLLLILLFAIGVYTSSLSESFFKMKDSSRIVIDEIHAMLLVSFLLPDAPGWWGAGFILFRLFDITKPPPIRNLEKLQGGWGVMMDDLMAAGYTVGLLRLSEKIYAMVSV
jgi:phosphatidylglycerophosphatase A